MALATGLHQGASLAAGPAGGPGGAGAAAAEPALSGFGSLLPDDSELSHAVEAAIAAAAAAAEPPSNGGKEGGVVAAAAGPAAATTAQQRPCWRQPNGLAAAGVQRRGWWPGVKACVCTYQFGAGLAAGLAIGASAAAVALGRGR